MSTSVPTIEKLPDLDTSLCGGRDASRALQAPGPSLPRLVGLELRKAVDTRAGRWVLLAVVGLAVASIAYRLLKAEEADVSMRGYLGDAMLGVQLLLPVLGVMAMTSE